jgi:WD40 repeat protein
MIDIILAGASENIEILSHLKSKLSQPTKYIACLDEESDVLVWDSECEYFSKLNPGGRVYTITFVSRKQIALGSNQRTLLYDLEKSQQSALNVKSAYGKRFQDLLLLSDNYLVGISNGTVDDTLHVWDIHTRQELSSRVVNQISKMARIDNKMFIVVERDTLSIRNEQLHVIRQIRLEHSFINRTRYSLLSLGDSKLLFCFSIGKVLTWNYETNEREPLFVAEIVIRAGDKLVMKDKNTVFITDLKLSVLSKVDNFIGKGPFAGCDGWFFCVDEDTLLQYNMETKQVEKRYNGSRKRVVAIATFCLVK